MPGLKDIKAAARDAAAATAFAIGVDIEIVDSEMELIAKGTPPGRVKTYKGESTNHNSTGLRIYDLQVPIVVGDHTMGWIKAVAPPDGRQIPKNEGIRFLIQMSGFLASTVSEQEALLHQRELEIILETIHEGALVIDSAGIVTYCNNTAEQLLKVQRKEILGKHLNQIWADAPALETLKTGKEYTEKEEIYNTKRRSMHFIVTVRLITGKESACGVVISFRDIAEARRLIYDLSEKKFQYTFEDIIGKRASIERLKEQAKQVANSNSTVLITGESGTGKEVFARAIHYYSYRSGGPFISLNCGAIPENLLESELYGYERGAFTGALKEGKTGKFELADGGTIFLDEIGEMPLHLQVKLLHVLQNREIERVGGNKKIPVNVRIIAASNRDLEKMMQDRTFRKDLYFRLGVIPLHIPPLRNRKEDILLFIKHFLDIYADKLNKHFEIKICPEVIDILLSYHWPGNVRELENAIEYAVNMCDGHELTVDMLPPRLYQSASAKYSYDKESTLRSMVLNYEKKIIEKHLERFSNTSGVKSNVARALGISRATLYRKMSELDIPHD